MRFLGQIKGEEKASAFQAFLQREHIESRLESKGKEDLFNLWIYREDDLQIATHWLNIFLENSSDPRFQNDKHPLDEKGVAEFLSKNSNKQSRAIPIRPSFSRTPITRIIIFVCMGLFFLNGYQLYHLKKTNPGAGFFNLTPLFMHLSYDVPQLFLDYLYFFKKYPIERPLDFEKLPLKAKKEFQQIREKPNWQGLYSIFLNQARKKKPITGPMFIKLRKGQIYRLVTPCLLHAHIFHIFFNMLLFFFWGKQVEERTKSSSYLFIMLIIATVSNTAQYLMTGSLFLGYSGVILGLAGFIWGRQQLAPWEGYPLHRFTIGFLAVYVLGLTLFQIISFFLTRFDLSPFAMNIANTAHIVGAATGMILGSISSFSKGHI